MLERRREEYGRRVRMYVDNGDAETKPGDWSRRSWKMKPEASRLGHEYYRMRETRAKTRAWTSTIGSERVRSEGGKKRRFLVSGTILLLE
jgi:hypothetical protein